MQVGKPVTGKDFLGRAQEVKELVQYLHMGQSITLIAPRRFGKTSLVLEALKQLKKKGHYISFVDVFSTPTIRALAVEITKETLKNQNLDKAFLSLKHSAVEMIRSAKLKGVVNEFELVLSFGDNSKDDWEILKDSIDLTEKFATKNNKKMICAFDEFGDVNKFGGKEKMSKLFRSKMQQQKHTTHLFSGSYESVMQNMFVSPKSPFYRLTRIIRLGYLSQDVLHKYYQRQLKGFMLENKANYCRQIIASTKGHPYYAQLALQQIKFEYLVNKKVLQPQILLEEMMYQEKDYLEKIWEEASANKENRLALTEVARSSKGVYSRLKDKGFNINRALRSLEGKGLLFKNEDGYYLADPLFEYWIKTHVHH